MLSRHDRRFIPDLDSLCVFRLLLAGEADREAEMIIEVKQELLDKEMAPVYDRCRCCDCEIYSSEEYELYEGYCERCFLAMEDEDG